MQARLKSLRNQHNTLDALIRREQLHRFPDSLHVRALKKFKLRVRDEISRIEMLLPKKQVAN